MSFLNRLQPLGLLVLRVVLGVVLLAHGKNKVFGGLHAHLALVHSLGMPAWLGYLSTATEFVGGALLILGLLTRFVGLAVCVEMCVALSKLHWPHGDRPGGPADLPLLIAASGFLFIWFGAGSISLDAFFGKGGKRR